VPALAAFVVIGLLFGALAGVSAFLIVFEELRRHKLGSRARREALGSAIFAFIFFAVAAMALGVVFVGVR
jgi:hypothetical protein